MSFSNQKEPFMPKWYTRTRLSTPGALRLLDFEIPVRIAALKTAIADGSLGTMLASLDQRVEAFALFVARGTNWTKTATINVDGAAVFDYATTAVRDGGLLAWEALGVHRLVLLPSGRLDAAAHEQWLREQATNLIG